VNPARVLGLALGDGIREDLMGRVEQLPLQP